MATYAVIENGVVINTVVADTKEIAELVTKKECLLIEDENTLGRFFYWDDTHKKYIPPSPLPSWVYDGNNWNPPIPMPEKEGKYYTWDEPTVSWLEFDAPVVDESFFEDETPAP